MIRLLGIGVLLVPLVAHAGWTSRGKLELRSGLDTNPSRAFGDLVSPDATATFTGTAGARCAFGHFDCAGRYVLGLRGFASQMDSDTLAQEAALRMSERIGDSASIGLEGSGKDVRGGARPYDDLRAGVTAALRLGAFDLSLEGFGRRFLYPSIFGESFSALGVDARLLRHFGRHHAVFIAGDLAARRLQSEADSGGISLGTRRMDRVWSASAGWTYRGPFSLELAYRFRQHTSNSQGESWFSGALTASVGVRLPWKLVLLVRAHLELTHYVDGLSLSPELLLLEEGEHLDAVAAELIRPIARHVDLSLRYGLYQTRLPSPPLAYARQVATFGISYRF